MGFLLPQRATKPIKPAMALRVQTALQGQPIAILVGGQQRLGCNLIDYVDFTATAENGGGKGAVGAGGGKGEAGGSYTYKVAVICSICEGPVSSIDGLWNNKSRQTLAKLNFTDFIGSYSQSAWGYMTSAHPTRALPYHGICYAAAGKLSLGNVPELPNLNFEVTAVLNTAITGAPDADPADCVIEVLTNAYWGVPGWPAAMVGALTDYSNYCIATGMVVSPILSGETASAFLSDLFKGTNSEARWSNGVLDVVPYGDETITANGVTYEAVTTPVYDLDDDAFVYADGDDPIKVTRAAQSDQKNLITVEYLNRAAGVDSVGDSLAYDPAVVEAKDDSDIQTFGLRPIDKRSWHFFCLTEAAQMSAALELGRQQVRNTYKFTLKPQYILLDPMDIVTLTDEALGLYRKPVRIKEITENSDKSLAMMAEDYLIGSAGAPQYGSQANDGNIPDYDIDPGNINTPNPFEPTDQLGGALEIWLPISGQDLDLWGGCDVYVSTDDDTYQLVGRINGNSRTGYLTSPLAAVDENPTGQTIDPTNPLSVSLVESGGELTSGSQADALALNTACRVGSEYIAYQTATLTSANAYDLTYLVRGAYGTEAEIATWPIGTPFTRLGDATIMKVPFTADRVGATVFFKFASFNIWGGGLQSLADVGAFSYEIQGTALASPLPDIENLRMTFVDSTSALTWDEISDFRPVMYEIRKGTTWDGALTLGRVAHPPFVTYGDGTYWVAGVTTPIAGLTVYSETPTSIVVSGSILETNVVATWDEAATGWPGYITGPGIITSGIFKTTASGAPAYYEIPQSHWLFVNYSRPTRLGATWLATGEPLGQNILDIADYLNDPDILGALSALYVTSFVEVATANGTPVDIFSYGDMFALGDIFVGDLAWGDWTKFAPGVYVGTYFKFRLSLESFDEGTVGDALAFSILGDVDDRVDHTVNYALSAAGETFTFTPDGGTATAFNGGPNGATVPLINVQVLNSTAGDDVQITGVSLSQATIKVVNGGVGVARNINATFQGY